MPPIFHRRFRWKDDQVVVQLLEYEQELLRHLLPQLRDVLMMETDPSLRRLHPEARPDDPEAEAAYRKMVDDDLLRSRLEAIEVVEAGIDGAVLDDEGITAWMHSLNALRLVLADRLDLDVIGHEAVEDLDDDDPRQLPVVMYDVLSNLLGHLVDAAMNGLPEGDD